MRLPFFILLAFALLVAASSWLGAMLTSLTERNASLAAVFINDSSVVEFTGSTENPPPIGSSQVNLTSSGSPTTQTPSNDDEEETSTSLGTAGAPSTPVVEEVVVTTSAQPSAAAGTTAEPPPPASTLVSVEEVLTTLIGSQAIIGLALGGGGSGGITALSELRFNGDKVREALRAQRITELAIPNRSALLAQKQVSFTRSDFALFVASATLDDPNIEEVSFFSGTLATRYRALGRVFGFIPVRYTLRVETVFAGGTLTSLRLRYPWYSLVLAKGISPKALTAKLEETIRTETAGFSSEYDIATRAFVAVSDTLRLQFGDF